MNAAPEGPDMTRIDALLTRAQGGDQNDPLPPVADRKRLRNAWNLTQKQVADAIGVTPGNVGGWEAGRWEPTGAHRVEYAYLLRNIAERLGEPTTWEESSDDQH